MSYYYHQFPPADLIMLTKTTKHDADTRKRKSNDDDFIRFNFDSYPKKK